MSESLELWDYRRRVSEIYSRVRCGSVADMTWHQWVADRDDLFGSHPQSVIEDRSSFSGLAYFDYDPGWRATGRFSPVEGEEEVLAHSGKGSTTFRKIGGVRFEVMGHPGYLEVLWLDAYGGGIFLPFRDATNGDSTYGGGRYLLDTVKGADLGHEGDEIVLDFNYAYHPSCVHSTRWSCPLSPAANMLGFEVGAGERLHEAPSNPPPR
ncbi:MAG: DUF1684 domain-containing protein [Acidimicrobiia bacterium]